MKKIRDVWLLVKPDFADSLKPGDVEKYKQIIDMIAKDPRSTLIMIPSDSPPFDKKTEGELEGYARKKIPEGRFSLRGINPQMKAGVDRNTRILACGAYLTHCVLGEASDISRELKIPKKNIFVLPRYSTHIHAHDFGSFLRGQPQTKKYYPSELHYYGISFQKVPSFEKKLERLKKK